MKNKFIETIFVIVLIIVLIIIISVIIAGLADGITYMYNSIISSTVSHTKIINNTLFRCMDFQEYVETFNGWAPIPNKQCNY